MKNKKLLLSKIFHIVFIPSHLLLVLVTIAIRYTNSSFLILKEILAFGILCFLGILIQLTISPKFKTKSFWILNIYLTAVIFIKTSFILRYRSYLNASAFYIIFETNTTETVSFLDTYFNYKSFILFIILLLPTIVYFYLYIRNKNYFISLINLNLNFRYAKLCSVLIAIACGFILHYKFSNQDLLISSYLNYKDYQKFIKNKKDVFSNPYNSNIGSVKTNEKPQTHIIVIGESTSNHHMQLYGYSRETNPLLSKITDEIILFKNTISPHAHTQPSLYKIFTLADFKNKKPKTNSSIIQLANLGGYTTYWISNQRPIGVDETIPTILSNAAHSSKFIATDNYNSLDGQLLPEIDKVLTHKNQKKVIFIHLMGSHFNYSSRYPRRFNYFNDSIPPYNENKNNTHKYINNYDNAVRYNDFVIYNILKKIKKKQISSTLTYFSDHGEDVFRTIDFFGHSEYYCSRPMLDVPYFFWASEKFKTTFPSFFKNPSIINRKYSLEDYYHTFAETCGIKFNDFDPQKSIFNPKFCERERLIKKGINYDQR